VTDLTRFKDARDLGCEYLLRQLRPDGGFGDPDNGVADYYKVPSAFQVCGQSEAANLLCSWIRANRMTADGDFGPRPDDAAGYPYAYYNTWVVTGAHRLAQFDLSQRGMDFLMGFWDEESGGFYSSPTERAASTKQDLWVVSGCGQAALYTGRTEVARSVGRWMKTMMDAQPEYPEKMYTVYSRDQGLITVPDPDDDIRYVLHNDVHRDQYFFHPGIAGGFLANLYKTTGESEWLDLSMEYMRFAEGANDYLFKLGRAGKVGWAASVLYTLTGEQKYKDMAVRVGDNLIAAQSEDGWWPSTLKTVPSNDATAELVVWLDEINQAVGSE
jgi:hypothetical protein